MVPCCNITAKEVVSSRSLEFGREYNKYKKYKYINYREEVW